MKTNLIRLLMAGIGMLLMACVLSHTLSAQTIISFDTSQDHSMVMKIQNHDLTNAEHTFIFIFDSASVTYEFDENGVIALYPEKKYYNGPTSTFYINSGSGSTRGEVKKSDYDIDALQWNEVAEEEPMELEPWMLAPDTWIN